MRAIAAAAVLSVCAVGATVIAQTGGPDLSGRWRLVAPTATQLANETLTIGAPDELLVNQTSRQITIAHPSQPGTHPEAGTLEYGSARVSGQRSQRAPTSNSRPNNDVRTAR